MTFLSSFAIKPVRHGNGQAPRHLDFSEISLVVPVHNNRQGTQRLLAACLDVFSPRRCPVLGPVPPRHVTLVPEPRQASGSSF